MNPPAQLPRICAYCHKPISKVVVFFQGREYHALQDENGTYVERPNTCWDKSEQGKKAL